LFDDNAAAAGAAATEIQHTIRSTTSSPHLTGRPPIYWLSVWPAAACRRRSPAYNRSPTVAEAENRRHGMQHGGKNGDDDDDGGGGGGGVVR